MQQREAGVERLGEELPGGGHTDGDQVAADSGGRDAAAPAQAGVGVLVPCPSEGEVPGVTATGQAELE